MGCISTEDHHVHEVMLITSSCEINYDLVNHTPNWLQNSTICTQQDNYILQDGFKSFPSGHASVSFAGLFYLSLYLAAKLHVLDAKGEVWRTFLVMVPTLGAALITGTRIMDARHHPFDVISGAMLGVLVSWASYRQYFPPVSETWRKGRAHPLRAWGRGPASPPIPTITVDEDTQPLRPRDADADVDVERGDGSGFSSSTAVPGDGDRGNVFRKQISDSQRRRQQEPFVVDRSDTITSSNYRSDTMGSTMSTKVSNYQSQLPSTNPFSEQRRMDTYDYSSSEDEERYELQPGRFTDTSYHRPSDISPHPSSPPHRSIVAPPQQSNTPTPTGDLSERRDGAPAPPAHTSQQTPSAL